MNKLTDKQISKIRLKLREDILERYDNLEYWDMDLLKYLIREEGLEYNDDIDVAIDKVINCQIDE